MKITEYQQEFIAKTFADIGKTVGGVGLATYFFEKFPSLLRICMSVLAVIFIVVAFFIHPKKRGD